MLCVVLHKCMNVLLHHNYYTKYVHDDLNSSNTLISRYNFLYILCINCAITSYLAIWFPVRTGTINN